MCQSRIHDSGTEQFLSISPIFMSPIFMSPNIWIPLNNPVALTLQFNALLTDW